MRGVTLQQLRAFTVVAKHLAFGKAAEELCLTPPAVSMQIKDLEQTLRIGLFSREGSRVNLTIPGEHLLFYARRVFSTLKDAETTIAGIRGAVRGPLTVGVVGTANYFVPRLLARFLAEYPSAEPRIVVGKRKSLLEGLESHALDLAILARAPDDEASIRCSPFAPLQSVLVASPSHPLAHQKRCTAAALRGCRFIVRENGSDTRAAMDCFFLANDLRLTYAIEMGSSEAVKQAVVANLGIAFLPMHAVRLECQAGLLKVLDIDAPRLAHKWHVAHSPSHLGSPMVEALRYYLLEHGERFVEADLLADFGAPGKSPLSIDADKPIQPLADTCSR